jgi:hypothetical protein
MNRKLIYIIALLSFSFMLTVDMSADNRAGEEINWQVISSGGVRATSPNYILNGTVGQTAVGFGSSPGFELYHGYWQDFGGPCDCLPGDATGDVKHDMLDILHLIAYLYKGGPPPGGPPPTPYTLCSGDADCDCKTDMLDILFLIAYLYKGGPAPCTCEDWLSACGPPLRTGQ